MNQIQTLRHDSDTIRLAENIFARTISHSTFRDKDSVLYIAYQALEAALTFQKAVLQSVSEKEPPDLLK